MTAEPSLANKAPRGASHALAYDVVVVGAGVIGLACGWRAAERGLRTCVIDRAEVGAGASGVAAGMLAPVGEASWGEEELLELNLASARAWPEFARELAALAGQPVPYRRCGALHVALDRDEAEALRRLDELHRRLGLDTEWLRPSQCRALEPGLSTACAGGIHAREEAEIDAQPLLVALARALRRSGATLLEGVGAEELLVRDGAVAGIRLADGREIEAPSVVVATGSWSGSGDWLAPELRPPVRPVKGEILTLRGSVSQPACERIIVSDRVYLVPRADGRLTIGATVEERGFDQRVTAGGVHELLREAYRALPEVAELELVSAVAGLRPGTPDNKPLIGRGAVEGLLVATGHYRNGVLLAPLTADAVAALLAGAEPPVALHLFDPLRFGPGRVPEPDEPAGIGAR